MKQISLTVAIISIVFLALPVGSLAQGPPINTDTPILLGLEGKAAMVRTIVVKKSRLYQDGRSLDDSLQREVTALIFPIAVPYNVFTDFQVGILVPVMNVQTASIASSNTSFGIGDISVFSKYLVVQVDKLQETFRVIIKGGVKFPTGNKNLTPALGTGTVDYSMGTAAAWIGRRFGVYGDFLYGINGTLGGYKYGNGITYSIAFGFRAVPAIYETYPTDQWNLYLELNGKYTLEDEQNGPVPNSGGNIIFLSPGVQYIPSREYLLEASVQIPVHQKLNGTQLGTNFTANLGIRLLFF